jgi:hypothetical protein
MASPIAPFASVPLSDEEWVNWPTNLPKCVSSWKEDLGDLRIRTPMSVGRPKTRKRHSAPTRLVQVGMELPKEDYVELRAFYEAGGSGSYNTGGTDGGDKFFKFTHPYDGEAHFYKFTKGPSITGQGATSVMVLMEWEEL